MSRIAVRATLARLVRPVRLVMLALMVWPHPAAFAVEFEGVDSVAPSIYTPSEYTPSSVAGAESAGIAMSLPKKTGGMFLPSDSGTKLWRQTLATVSADWPIVRTVEPDFRATPPREGLIESAWLEPQDSMPAARGLPTTDNAWPPRRQRVVIRVVPAVNGAWIDAIVETQSIADAYSASTPGGVELTGGWPTISSGGDRTNITTTLAARMATAPGGVAEPVYSLPALEEDGVLGGGPAEPPWAHSQHPRLARTGYKVLEDYRNFYSCESLTCLTAAFGAGALMANTGFDTTMQNAWQQGVAPTDVGTFFSDCKPIGEGKYALAVFGAAAATGIMLEGRPSGDIIGEWGSRSLRMFVVGAPPLYVLQLATGASRPADDSSAGSRWHFNNDNNGVSGHAFVGAIPFLAAAEMVENPLAKGTLYVCSTFVGFSRMTDNAHYPSQVFLGWYLAWASSMAVSRTETHFAGMEVRVVPLPMADMGGLAVETKW
ncbi:MAG: phosphatase PAP2 family protein [Planctomycetia bacterium]|nr:phosphatase PAP2 family protein [Planctomycetia bacterium]